MRALPIGVLGCALLSALLGCTALVDGDTPFAGDAGPRDAGLDASTIDAAVDAGPLCRDGLCALGETCSSCPDDCCDAGADDAGIDGGMPEPLARWIATGADHTCAITSVGDIVCWGATDHGQLGEGSPGDRGPRFVALPTAMPEPVVLCAGDSFTCALTRDRDVWCWGANTSGQLGTGTVGDNPSPTRVDLTDVDSIACGTVHACAVHPHSAGIGDAVRVSCWGDNSTGQLGLSGGMVTTPTQLGLRLGRSTSTGAFPTLGAGEGHTCASAPNVPGTFCWGANGSAQVTSPATAMEFPLRSDNAAGDGRPALTAYGLGSSHSCGFLNRNMQCWGDDGAAQVTATPPTVATVPWSEVSAGSRFTCGRAGSFVQCWGSNDDDALGSATPTATSSNVVAIPDGGARDALGALSAGGTHACAITASGAVACWGDNGQRQVYPGGLSPVDGPVLVPLPTP